MKTVFETSFALEKLLQVNGYYRSEPNFSIIALGTSINAFSSKKQIHKNELIIEVIPPYYFNFQFNNFDTEELDKADKFFFDRLEHLVIGLKQLGIKLMAIILHGGGQRKTPGKVNMVDLITYTSKEEQHVKAIFKFDGLKEKLPELEGIFE